MKNIFLLLALLMTLAGAGCNNTAAPEAQKTETTTEKAAATQQLAFICPMSCEGSASAAPGKCPTCGMGLEKNPDHQAATADSAAHSTH